MRHIKKFNSEVSSEVKERVIKLNENLWQDPNFVTGIVTAAALFLGLSGAFIADLSSRAKQKLSEMISTKASEAGISKDDYIKNLSKEDLLNLKKAAKSESAGNLLNQASDSLSRKGGSLV